MISQTPARLVLGQRTRSTAEPITVVSRSHSLNAHIGKPWFNDYIQEHFEHVVDAPEKQDAKRGDPFIIDPGILATNAAICGVPGKGKTRLAMHLFREQLKAGCSAVVIDVQNQTLRMAIQAALEVGMTPDQITVVRTNSGESVPGWNPFDRPEEDRRAAVKQFVALVLNIFGTGARLGPLLKNAATLIASERLSMLELVEFLAVGSDYRTGLLGKIAASPDAHQFRYELKFFQEFSTWTKAKQAEFVDPVLARLSVFATEPFFQALLCARSDALDFASLWKRQRLILVLLDEFALGEEETALMTSLFTYTFLATAMRHPKSDPVPVLLYVDEMGVQQKFSGNAVASIIAAARQKNVRVMAACQFLNQLPEGVQTAVLSASCRAFFGLVDKDAAIVATSLTKGKRSSISKIAVTAGSEIYSLTMYVVDAGGHRVSVGARLWDNLTLKLGWEQSALLRTFAERSGMAPLSLDYNGQRVPLGSLPADTWTLASRSPLTITVSFPRPKVDVVTRKSEADQASELQSILTGLPRQHAVVWAEGEQAEIRVIDTDFPDDLPELESYCGNGQSGEEIAETLRWRYEQIASLAGKPHPPAKRQSVPAAPALPTSPELQPLDVEEFDDGSL